MSFSAHRQTLFGREFFHLRHNRAPLVDSHGKSHGFLHQRINVAGLVNNMMIHALIGGKPGTGVLHVLDHVHGHGFFQQCIHTR